MAVIENITISASVFRQVRALAENKEITIDQFVASAVAEKAATFLSYEHLQQRASKGNREDFHRVLEKVPDVEPGEKDRLERK